MGLRSAETYRKRVGELGEALLDPELRVEAMEIIRGLITRVTVTAKEDGVVLGLEGALSALIGLGQAGLETKGKGRGSTDGAGTVFAQAVGPKAKSHPVGGCSIELVAGAGFGHCFILACDNGRRLSRAGSTLL